MIYLDYTANTPVEPQVLEAFCEAERRFVGNANARHGMGQETAKAIDRATTVCAELLNVRPEEVIFNSGASEGNNTAIMGIAHASPGWKSNGVEHSFLETYDDVQTTVTGVEEE